MNVMEIMAGDMSQLISLAQANLKYVPTTINVEGFDVKHDGTTDDTVNFQNAINYAAANNKNLYIPAGTYRITGSGLTLNQKVCMFGAGGKTILKYEGNGTCITVSGVTGSFPFWTFQDINISVGANGSGIDASGSESLTISRVNVYQPGFSATPQVKWTNPNQFGISGSSQAFIAHCNFENLGIGIKVNRQNVWVDNCYVAVCFEGMKLLAESVNIDNSHFYYCDRGISTEGATVGINFVTMTGCTLDSDNHYGILMKSNCNAWVINGCFISNMGGNLTVDPGIHPSGIYGIGYVIQNMRITGCGIGAAQWGGHGIYLDSAPNPNNGGIIITGCSLLSNKGSAIILNNLDTAELTGNWIGNNLLYGVTGTGSKRISITGGYIGGNTVNISLPVGSYTAANVTGVNPIGFVNAPARPIVSGTVYQNTAPVPVEIHLIVRATTLGTKGRVDLAMGDTATVSGMYGENIAADSDATNSQAIRVVIPVGWYYRFTGSGATFLDTLMIGI